MSGSIGPMVRRRIFAKSARSSNITRQYGWRTRSSRCTHSATQVQSAVTKMPTRTLLPVKATADEESLLSSFSDLRAGWEVDEYIEPLTGIARHPLFKMPGCPWRNGSIQRHGKFDIGYLILTNHCDEQGHPRQRCSSGRPARARNLFFDLGCSTYSGNVSLETGSGIGPSMPIFIQLYEWRCIEFDMIYAWEATPHAGATWWDTVRGKTDPRLAGSGCVTLECTVAR
jgi:hypothetical protein